MTDRKRRKAAPRPKSLPLVQSTFLYEGDMSLESVRRAFVGDFYGSWDSVAASRQAQGRGNFMYAFMATNYLEWAGTVAAQDSDVAKLFAAALGRRDPHYFAKLPAPWPEHVSRWFPAAADGNQNHLLWAVFDLVRNGVAHRYQQIDAVLSDGRFRIQIVGAEAAAYRAGRRPLKHMRPFEVRIANELPYLVTRLFPDVLFADVDAAVATSGLVELPPLKFRRKYPVTVTRLRRAVGVGKRRTT